jgi:uncharacterized membrane protein SirB2
MDYATLKVIHVGSALLSVAGFTARGVLMLFDSPLLASRLVRVAPHVVDTILLASAIALVWMSGQYPFVQTWLTAKVLALLAYIVLGSIALGRGRTKRARVTAFMLAFCTVCYIVAVALTRRPLVFS